jgi:hypothetical protein
MKTIKWIDFGVQATLLLFGLGVLLFLSTEANWPFQLLWVQMILGPWQLISAIILCIATAQFRTQRLIYLFVSIAWLILLSQGSKLNFESASYLKIIGLIAVPWIFAAYYFNLTRLSVFPRQRKRGNFLPHLSF